ncbi:MAG: Holliday junction resolvase RuvX [Patescibacteria group bacterium]
MNENIIINYKYTINTMIILALDYGIKRIGLAKGDTESCIARPFGIVENKSDEFVFNNLTKIIKEEWIDEILIGAPHGLTGEDTDQTKYTLDFVNKLKNVYKNIKVTTIDERLSSRQASTMISKKGHLDDVAATVFLQDYIDKLSRGK